MPTPSQIALTALIFGTLGSALIDRDVRGLSIFTISPIAIEPSVWPAPVEVDPLHTVTVATRTATRTRTPYQSPAMALVSPPPEVPPPLRPGAEPRPPTAFYSQRAEGSGPAANSVQVRTANPYAIASALSAPLIPAPTGIAPEPFAGAPVLPSFVTFSGQPVVAGGNGTSSSVLPVSVSPTPIDPAPVVGPVLVDVVPAVPEPSSWLMMILGVGALGLVLRSNRNHLSVRSFNAVPT